jgi:hypothetical protein
MSMMHYPKHLHGHFFRVLSTQGEYSPFKHTVDVVPMTTTAIRFAADEFGDWFFHCNNRTPKKVPTTNKKGEGHEKTKTYEPHHPFQPRIGLGLGDLASCPIAIRRAGGR